MGRHVAHRQDAPPVRHSRRTAAWAPGVGARAPWLASALVVIAAAVAFLPSLSGQLIWDDRALLEADARLHEPGGLARIWNGPFIEPGLKTHGRLYYRPLTTLSFLIDERRGGGDPAGAGHATNLLLHAVASLLAFWLARRWLPGTWPPLAVALFFALHPSRTESVCWISGRTDLLSGTFLLGAFLLFTADGPRRRPLRLLSVAAFLPALLAKESALVLPALLALHVLLVEPAPGAAARWRRVLARTGAHWLVAGAYLLLLLRLGALAGPPARVFAAWPERGLYVLQTLDLYGLRLLWPLTFTDAVAGLLPEGLRWYGLSAGTMAVIGTAALGLATVTLWWWARRRPPLAFALAAWPVSLLPALNLIPLPGVLAVRLLYVPAFFGGLALWLLGATVARALLARRPLAVAPALGVALPAAVLVALGVVSFRQSAVWRDEQAFWDYQVRAAPGSANAQFLAGWSLFERGRLPEALAYGERAIGLAPANTLFLLSHGNALLAGRRLDRAEEVFRQLGRLGIGDGTPANRLGVTLAEKGRVEDGLAELRRAAAISPRNAGFHADLGVLLLRAGRPEESARALETALGLEPARSSTWGMLARARAALGNREGALEAARRGVALAPADPLLRQLTAELEATSRAGGAR